MRKVNRAIELYDLQTDVAERYDIAVAHPEILRRVEEILKAAHTESEFWPVSRSVQLQPLVQTVHFNRLLKSGEQQWTE